MTGIPDEQGATDEMVSWLGPIRETDFGRVFDGEFSVERRLDAGEAIVYDNQRILHGRTAITGSRSRRHLRLCTVDRDQVHSRLRRLSERYAPGTEERTLSPGSRT